MRQIFFILYAFYISTCCFSQAGSLDFSFGDSGKVISDGFGECKASGIQSTGKIILAGDDKEGGNNSVARYNIDGSLDKSFGDDGRIVTNDSHLVGVTCMAILPDDKFITAGYLAGAALVRYNANGTPDSSFGEDGNGIVFTYLGAGTQYKGTYITAIAIQPDRKIVAAGFDGNAYAIVIRYTPNGMLDKSFGNNGVAEINSNDNLDYWTEIYAAAVQPDGKILIGGEQKVDKEFLLIRLNPDGSLDNSFDKDGRVIINFSPDEDRVNKIVVLPDGEILTGVSINTNYYSGYMAVIKCMGDGKLDSSFGINGMAQAVFPDDNAILTGMALQQDNKICVGGYVNSIFHPFSDFALARFNKDGSLDAGFGNNGLTTSSIDTGELAYALSIQQDGKIILAGRTVTLKQNNDYYPNFALTRYNNDAALPLQFTYFNATTNNGGIALNWQTAQENNNDYFAVERSGDSRFRGNDENAGSGNDGEFEIARVPSNEQQGTSNEKQNYSYTDNTPLQGTNFYRLKQVDKDGRFSYSQIVSATFENGLSVILYPNPVRDVLNIKGLFSMNSYQLTISNNKGNAVASTQINNTSTYKWNLQSLSKGVYYLNIISNNKTTTVKFVKE